MTSPLHPFDEALQLRERAPGHYDGQASPAYWNMVGPFGGVTAAVLLRAVQAHPECLGDPVALTVNFGAAVAAGAYTVQATPVRTNRSTQHWNIALVQEGEGGSAITTTATAVTALRRETWSVGDTLAPRLGHPEGVARTQPPVAGVEWLNRYEMRPISGAVPLAWDGSGDHSLSQLWMRDDPPRPVDFCSLAALSDVFFPRVWLRRARPVPAGTVSITVYFHAGPADLAATGSGYLLGQARGQEFRNGFFDQTAQLWNQAGTLLTTTHQIVYYKE